MSQFETVDDLADLFKTLSNQDNNKHTAFRIKRGSWFVHHMPFSQKNIEACQSLDHYICSKESCVAETDVEDNHSYCTGLQKVSDEVFYLSNELYETIESCIKCRRCGVKLLELVPEAICEDLNNFNIE